MLLKVLSLSTICNGNQDSSSQLVISICYRPGGILDVTSTVVNKPGQDSKLTKFIKQVSKYMSKIMIIAKRKQNKWMG